jgi:hypothetical protein
MGSGTNFRRGRELDVSSESFGLLSLELLVVVSTGSGANFLRGLGAVSSSGGLSLSLLFLVLVSMGSGVNFRLEDRAVVSSGSAAKRLGGLLFGTPGRVESSE